MERGAEPPPVALQGNKERPAASQTVRFVLGMIIIASGSLLFMFILNLAFLASNWSSLRSFGFGEICRALWMAIRFDAAALSALLIPAALLYHAAAITQARVVRWALRGYLVLLVLWLTIIAVGDVQYFEESGRHFTYEVFTHLTPTDAPVFKGAFALHPILNSAVAVVIIGLIVLTWLALGRLFAFCFPRDGRRHPLFLLGVPAWAGMGVFAFCGLGFHDVMRPGDALISPSPYVNALCVNPSYSILWTLARQPGRELTFFDEAHNVRVVRQLLGCGDTPPISEKYPLLRQSPGTPQGNRRNVVIFLLESWTGRDIGCLGGDKRMTPVFDELARGGLLFTHFYANGIRTPEGIISVLCSFPNQLHRPAADQPAMFLDRWRALSEILDEAGYATLFVHGRDLDFDNMSNVLRSLSFRTLIDNKSFPASVEKLKDSWEGYGDKDVVLRADAEFAALDGKPFLGVIYTMNTHPPFAIPPEFPRIFKDKSIASRFLNSLRYTDSTLGDFFAAARTHLYFKDTVFVFVADHARTRDTFNYDDQHRIAFLIYAPGIVQPGVRDDVASQLDILPTVLDLLNLGTLHSSWGNDLMKPRPDSSFAVAMAGDEARWHDKQYVLVDTMSGQPPLMFDLPRDPECADNCLAQHPDDAKVRQQKMQAFMTLSQDLLHGNRIYPPPGAVPR